MFDLDESEQKEFRMSVRRLAERRIPTYDMPSNYNSVPRALFKEFAAIGATGLSIDETFGGSLAPATLCALVFEEIAAVNLGPAIFTSVHSMVSGLINRFGSPEQKQRFLPKLASGEWLGAYALTEPSAGSDAAALKSTARLEGDSYIINGSKCYISSAGWADVYLVFAKTEPSRGGDGISAFIVEAGTAGFTVSSPEQKMGCELSPIASLTFADMRVPRSNLLGECNRGYAIALNGLSLGRVNIAACANGLSRAAIDRAQAHLLEREQFGHKLIEQQGLQFMLADMHIKLEAARLMTWHAAKEIETGAKYSRTASAAAKCFATDSAMSITTDAVQLLGGAGYIKDYAVERLMREAKMLQIVEGTNQIQRLLIARELTKGR